jgi:hypothetical protein
MSRTRRAGGLLAAGLAAAGAFAWLKSKQGADAGTTGRMLADDSADPAPFALVPLEERPAFRTDDRDRPFAALMDLEVEKGAARRELSPIELEEPGAPS